MKPDKNTLIIAISATALFDLAEQDKAFQAAKEVNRDDAIRTYRTAMREKEREPLKPGSAMPLVRALLALNSAKRASDIASSSPNCDNNSDSPLVEVLVVSQNSPETGLRILHAIESHGLNITRSAFLAGDAVSPILSAFKVDLFLSRNETEVQAVVDAGVCAAGLLVGDPLENYAPDERLRLAFDGDAVLFDEESEVIFKNKDLKTFEEHETVHREEPMNDGPFANFLRKLGKMQLRLTSAVEYAPIRIALVTARNAPSHLRVLNTLRHWGVYIDEAYFLGGMDKTPILEAIRPHLFFDDQPLHIERAQAIVPSALVPHKSTSPLRQRSKDTSSQ